MEIVKPRKYRLWAILSRENNIVSDGESLAVFPYPERELAERILAMLESQAKALTPAKAMAFGMPFRIEAITRLEGEMVRQDRDPTPLCERDFFSGKQAKPKRHSLLPSAISKTYNGGPLPQHMLPHDCARPMVVVTDPSVDSCVMAAFERNEQFSWDCRH